MSCSTCHSGMVLNCGCCCTHKKAFSWADEAFWAMACWVNVAKRKACSFREVLAVVVAAVMVVALLWLVAVKILN